MNRRKDVSAIILAGGKSIRMNDNKALLPISGICLIEKIAKSLEKLFAQILISASTPKTYAFLPYKIIVDEKPNQGPLMGILTSLKASKNAVNFIIACDIPDINFPFLKELLSHTNQFDIVVPITHKNQYEPLFAFYNKKIIPQIELLLAEGVRKINRLFETCDTKKILLSDLSWYHNLNTRGDYHQYLNQGLNK